MRKLTVEQAKKEADFTIELFADAFIAATNLLEGLDGGTKEKCFRALENAIISRMRMMGEYIMQSPSVDNEDSVI